MSSILQPASDEGDLFWKTYTHEMLKVLLDMSVSERSKAIIKLKAQRQFDKSMPHQLQDFIDTLMEIH